MQCFLHWRSEYYNWCTSFLLVLIRCAVWCISTTRSHNSSILMILFFFSWETLILLLYAPKDKRTEKLLWTGTEDEKLTDGCKRWREYKKKTYLSRVISRKVKTQWILLWNGEKERNEKWNRSTIETSRSNPACWLAQAAIMVYLRLCKKAKRYIGSIWLWCCCCALLATNWK